MFLGRQNRPPRLCPPQEKFAVPVDSSLGSRSPSPVPTSRRRPSLAALLYVQPHACAADFPPPYLQLKPEQTASAPPQGRPDPALVLFGFINGGLGIIMGLNLCGEG